MKNYKILAALGITSIIVYFLILRSKKRTITRKQITKPKIDSENGDYGTDVVYEEDTQNVSSGSSIVPPFYTPKTKPTTPKPLPKTNPTTLEEARQKALTTKTNVRFQNYICYSDGTCELARFSDINNPQVGGGGSSAPVASGGGGGTNDNLFNSSILWQIGGSYGAGGGQIQGSYQMSSTPSSKRSAVGISRYFK